MAYASGKHALAICDICGFPCDYTELIDYIFDQRPNGLRVCPSCNDLDNPQLQVGTASNIPEAISLIRPRPDSAELPQVRAFFGWAPVLGLRAQVTLGQVTVS
jgi:hypothetical protein